MCIITSQENSQLASTNILPSHLLKRIFFLTNLWYNNELKNVRKDIKDNLNEPQKAMKTKKRNASINSKKWKYINKSQENLLHLYKCNPKMF